MTKFKVLSGEEVAALDTDQAVKYFNDLNIHKAEQMDALKVQMKQEATDEVAKQINALRLEINENNTEQIKALQKSLDLQGTALNKLMSKGDTNRQKSIEDYLTEVEDKVKNAHKQTVTIKTDVTRGSLANSAYAYDIEGVGQIAYRMMKLFGLFAKGQISDGQGGVVRYVDQTTVTRAADWVAEAGVKPESAIIWVTLTVPLETIADTIPVTNQALRDIPFMASEINNFLLANLALKVDQDLWNGSGVAPVIFGVYTKADTFAAVASGVSDANLYDLISLMKTSVTKDSNYTPNAIILNPDDATKYLQLKKDGNNNYVLPPFVEMRNGVMYVNGMLVVETSAVVANTMALGDFTKATVYTQGGVNIDIGLIDKQFVENMVTVRAEQVMGLIVRNVHTNAFSKSADIAGDLVTIGT